MDDHTTAPKPATSTTSPIDYPIDVVANTVSTTSQDGRTNEVTTTMSTTPAMTSTLVLTTLASENAVTSSEPILYYAVGILAVLVLLVGALAILMLIIYAHKRQKEKKQRNREAIINLFITSMSMIQPHSQAMFPVFS